MSTPPDPRPEPVRIELERLIHRWQQLPVEQALPHVRLVHGLAQRYTDAVAGADGRRPAPLPDLGPAIVVDQLAVAVYDACLYGCAGDAAADLLGVRRAVNAGAPAPTGA